MIKKTIKYEDFDGNQREEDFYFNLTKAEIANMFASVDGGLDKKLERIVQKRDGPEIMETFREFIKRSYGEKSLDGREFLKSDEIYRRFEATEAYSVLFMELCTDGAKAADFIRGIVPKDIREQMDTAEKKNGPALLNA